jgi:hypothetical protein
MVKRLFLMLLLLAQCSAYALLERTQADLRVVEDRLRYEFGERGQRRADRDQTLQVTPILVAPPQPYWQESKSDFAASVMETLTHVFTHSGDLIWCTQCYENRVYMSDDNRAVIQNGELSLSDLARLRKQPAYAAAKSVLITRETPAGIEVRLLAVDDGRILYTGLADSTKNLEDVQPPLRLARELDRRVRGESLTYVGLDVGIYPQSLAQLKFLEQWGSRNQNLSGFVISGYNPTGALGVTYVYMLPFWQRRITAGATVFYNFSGMFQSSSSNSADALTGQLMVSYAVSGSYGFFVSASTEGKLSVGVNLMNPVLFPFLL